jgi:site-specific recombinase XerD
MEFQPVSERLKTEIVQRNHSMQTFYLYQSALKSFCGYFKDRHDFEHINSDEIKTFLAWVNETRGVCQERACFWALRFWYLEVIQQFHKFDHIKCPKVHRKIQIPPTHEYIMQKLDTIKCSHQKAIVAMFYTTGIRLMELCKIERANISRENLTMVLRRCKGGRDKIVVLSQEIIPYIEAHWKKLNPIQRTSKYLFPGEKPNHYISDTTAYRAVKANLDVNPHLLRHAYITYLHENGVSIEAIRDMVDHASITTTQIYTHTSVTMKRRLPNPLDKKKPANIFELRRTGT